MLLLICFQACALAETSAPEPAYFLRWEGETIRLEPATCTFTSPVVGVTTNLVMVAERSGESEQLLRFMITRLKSEVSASGWPSGDYALVTTGDVGAFLRFNLSDVTTVSHVAQSGSAAFLNEGVRMTVTFENAPIRNALTTVISPASGRMACE